MKKPLAMIVFGLLAVTSIPANAAPAVLEKKFANCAALNQAYPGGVAKSKSVKNKGGTTRRTPTVSPKVYSENKSKDRDGDGIACEK